MSTITTSKPLNGLFQVPVGTKLLGEIITWSCSGITIKHLDLIEALRVSGLAESVARELAPRHAFSRACKKLSDARIIRQVGEDENTITFQFTQESRKGDHFEYALETMLSLEKATGKVSCPLPGLATLAQEELDRCIQARTGSDVTKIIQKLFERQADLFAIRDQGGAYFCPQQHVGFLDKVQGFLGKLGGAMNRFPVPEGTVQGDRSVKETVAAGLAALIEEHNAAIDGFCKETRADTIERAAERIRQTRFKVEVYATLLAEQKAQLEKQLGAASDRLRSKVEELSREEAESSAELPLS